MPQRAKVAAPMVVCEMKHVMSLHARQALTFVICAMTENVLSVLVTLSDSVYLDSVMDLETPLLTEETASA